MTHTATLARSRRASVLVSVAHAQHTPTSTTKPGFRSRNPSRLVRRLNGIDFLLEICLTLSGWGFHKNRAHRRRARAPNDARAPGRRTLNQGNQMAKQRINKLSLLETPTPRIGARRRRVRPRAAAASQTHTSKQRTIAATRRHRHRGRHHTARAQWQYYGIPAMRVCRSVPGPPRAPAPCRHTRVHPDPPTNQPEVTPQQRTPLCACSAPRAQNPRAHRVHASSLPVSAFSPCVICRVTCRNLSSSRLSRAGRRVKAAAAAVRT